MRKTSLYDIDDVEAFVVMCIKRSGAPIRPYEYEDMIGEALVILYAMADKYIPQMEGYAQPGRFSGYVVKYLPRKIREAWHKNYEACSLKTMPDGKRQYVYYKEAESFDRLLHTDVDDAYFDERRFSAPGRFIPLPHTSS